MLVVMGYYSIVYIITLNDCRFFLLLLLHRHFNYIVSTYIDRIDYIDQFSEFVSCLAEVNMLVSLWLLLVFFLAICRAQQSISFMTNSHSEIYA